jgi:hypothetical protein
MIVWGFFLILAMDKDALHDDGKYSDFTQAYV